MMVAKIKVSPETLAKLIGDVHELAELVQKQARTIAMLEARLAVCETLKPVHKRDWWQDPIISFQGRAVRDAGEQANI